MNKCYFSIIILATLLIGCGSDNFGDEIVQPIAQEEPSTQGEQENDAAAPVVNLTVQQQKAMTQNNDFAFDYYRTVSRSEVVKGKSFVVSPISLTCLLGMVNAGASGQTRQEITRMLGSEGSNSAFVDELCSLMIDKVPLLDNSVSLGISNMVVTNQPVSLSETYADLLSEYYDAETSTLQFATPEAVSYVNEWCRQHTNGRIPSIVESLDGSIALLNAVSFKAPWSGKFDKNATRNETFIREDGSHLTLPMMHRDDLCYYYKGDNFKAVGLPFGNGENWSMYAILPDEGSSVDEVSRSLTADAWQNCVSKMTRGARLVDVKLPRFTVQSDVQLRDVLKQMGCESMFLPLGELASMTSLGSGLSVGMVKQKASIEVTEEGSEAAAVTIAVVYTSEGPDAEDAKCRFYADRPFIYLIQENTTQAVFFIGTFRG